MSVILEKLLVEYCAPTLAGIKIGSLFSYHYSSKVDAISELIEANHKLNERGVYLTVLMWRNMCALVYVYRKSHLKKQLERQEVTSFLSKYGYIDGVLEDKLKNLMARISRRESFPHEIGVFLGYPLSDVKGFIEHNGEDYKFCGLWKVYSNEYETKKLFEKLEKCSGTYLRVFTEGRSIVQMTVVL